MKQLKINLKTTILSISLLSGSCFATNNFYVQADSGVNSFGHTSKVSYYTADKKTNPIGRIGLGFETNGRHWGTSIDAGWNYLDQLEYKNRTQDRSKGNIKINYAGPDAQLKAHYRIDKELTIYLGGGIAQIQSNSTYDHQSIKNTQNYPELVTGLSFMINRSLDFDLGYRLIDGEIEQHIKPSQVSDHDVKTLTKLPNDTIISIALRYGFH